MCSRIMIWQHFFDEEEKYFSIKAFKSYMAILGEWAKKG